ncbi:MAG: hypothetical protein K9J16_11255 [Melioribacteraceae bacterium]|nr:hypothetical protein [Melioribacteraceae bacterium]MCF8353587.1 hypothetical protein [Melioribacteraceae bacterium]MCF8393510.1 hypothetical protein [Melioribacteraceae bacterium]MCF8419320.1 hypothetical protein [Melioribacteraceae bacterium]
MKWKFIFLILFSCLTTSAQTYYEVYSKIFPKSVLEQDENFEKKVTFYGSINPSLLYFYFDYLEARTDNDLNRINAANYKLEVLVVNALYQQKIFFDKQIQLLNESNYKGGAVIEATGYLEPKFKYAYKVELKTRGFVDVEKQNKITFLYLTKGNIAGDLSNKDYAEETARFFKSQVSKFSTAYEAKDNLDQNEKEHLINEAIKYYYLFESSPINYIDKKPSFQLYVFIVELLRGKYKETFSVSVAFNYFLLTEKYKMYNSFSKTFNTFLYNIDYSNSWETTLEPKSAVELSGKYILNKRKGIFSFIKFGASYIFAYKADKEPVSWGPYLESMLITNGIEYYNKITFSNRENESLSGYGISLETPIFYLIPSVYITAGVQYWSYSYSYNIGMESFAYIKEASSPKQIMNEFGEESYSGTFSNINPLFSVNIELFDYTIISAKFLSSKDFWLRAGVNYSFELMN